MQRFAITPLAIAAATPALADSGVHLHPHVSEPVWLPLLIGAAIVGAMGLLVWVKK